MTNVVLASGNRGKLEELSALLGPAGMTLCGLRELGIVSPPETGATFIENALIKARHASAASGFASIADDSGLVVPALDGAPGIRSARYAGEHASDHDNSVRLLRELATCQDRRAHYYCALVYLRSPTDPAPLIATGEWHGTLITTPRGTNGFGYDPHFLLPAIGKTAAELPASEKNRLSHRGTAVADLCQQLAAR